MRLIDADVLEPDADYDDGEYWAVSIAQIQNAPTIEERKKGKWLSEDGAPIAMKNGCPVRSCYCSECGEWLTASDEYYVKGNFCPNCSADMRGNEK